MKNEIPSLFSSSESEIETARDREREVKMEKKSQKFSRKENLALWIHAKKALGS